MFPLKALGTALLFASSLAPVVAENPWEFDDTDFFSNAARGGPPANELELNTRSGPITGHYALSGADTTTREFLGIPYARPPTGLLRFLPPAPHPRFWTPFVASDYSPACYNSEFIGDLGNAPISLTPPASESEDCLTLNVWAPSTARNPNGNAAVMIWVHGGGFVLGQSNSYLWNGGNIVRKQEDVIVVTINYRLNVFGYPAFPNLPPGLKNPGLLDVRAAIEWVKKNIAAFGGDPNKITLFGESAGAAATDAYLYYAKNDPIIHGAIIQSGSVQLPAEGLMGSINSQASWTTLSAHFNCPTTPLLNLLCLQQVPASDLRDAVNTLDLPFMPATDDGTLFTDHRARLKAGNFAQVPLLVGSNDQELPGTEEVWVNATRTTFGCPAANQAFYRAKRVPTWQYRYFGTWTAGSAFHGSEIAQVFGLTTAASPAAQVASSQWIQGAWVAFAKNPTNGLVNYGGGWPTFDANGTTLMGLAYNNLGTPTLLDSQDYNDGCYF